MRTQILNSHGEFVKWAQDQQISKIASHAPELYPCHVVWSQKETAYCFTYPFSRSGADIQFGRAATEQDAISVGRWLAESGFSVKIRKDGFSYKNTTAELPAFKIK